MTFINTLDHGQVNHDRIERISHGSDGKGRYQFRLHLTSGEVARTYRDPTEHVAQIIPASGWEFIMAATDYSACWAEPVIAWGLTLDGQLTPLVASELGTHFAENSFALRQVGSAGVYVPGDRTYETADEWLADRKPRGAAAPDLGEIDAG